MGNWRIMGPPVVTLYWPQRRLRGVLADAKRVQGEGDKPLWLVGYRVAQAAVCVVDFTHDRSSVAGRHAIIGICYAAPTGGIGVDDATLLRVEYTPLDNADAVDRSLRLVSIRKEKQPQPGVVVLYDPQLFVRGRARSGVASLSPKSPLAAPLQQLQDHFETQTTTSASRPTSPLIAVCEAVAYYVIGLPFAAANLVWQKTLLALISAPLLAKLPMGRGASLKDYSQSSRVFAHRFSNILTLPAQFQARYRSQKGGSCTELCDFIVYFFVDYALGLAFASFMISMALPVAEQMELSPMTFLDGLREQVAWLMDAPAGFKLNVRLAAILGNGILMWLDFWEFMHDAAVTSWVWQAAISSPKLVAMVVSCSSHAGLTLQLSMISDAVALVTWHSYWVFLYFTKLNAMQLRLLSSLWKLFLGQKNNVLRKRVDSCEYDVNQLLLGTLLFTILVFLVTTNAVFFVFFGLVRLGVWLVSFVLWVPVVVLRGLPFVSVLHRIVLPGAYTMSLSIETIGGERSSSHESLTIKDISPSRRRERDETDREKVREFFDEQSQSVTQSPVFFRVVTRPSSLGHHFRRLKAYQAQVTRSYSGAAIVNSCLFGAEIAPVDASVLFCTSTASKLPNPVVDTHGKQKAE